MRVGRVHRTPLLLDFAVGSGLTLGRFLVILHAVGSSRFVGFVLLFRGCGCNALPFRSACTPTFLLPWLPHDQRWYGRHRCCVNILKVDMAHRAWHPINVEGGVAVDHQFDVLVLRSNPPGRKCP